jgi:DNA-binding MarR family transcriptional regulator
MSTSRLKRYIPLAQSFSARVLLFHQAIARRVGLNATEFKCLRLVGSEPAMTVSRLAKETGLTLPAITVIVDRLEELGFVARERDADDRRKVAIRPDAAAKRRVDALYADYSAEVAKLLDGYSDAQFELILGYLTKVSELMRREFEQKATR